MTKEPTAGDLRHRITVERGTAAQDDFGQYQDSFTSLGTFWAQVTPLSGRELVNARQVKATTTHQILMRQNLAILPTDRILFQGRRFEIDSINRIDELNSFYRITCTELIPGTE